MRYRWDWQSNGQSTGKEGRTVAAGWSRPRKAEAAVSEAIRGSGTDTVSFLQADLSLMREVRRVAEHVRQTFDQLDVRVQSAGGVFSLQRTLTDEGLELSFAAGTLARFVLTNELLDPLGAAPAPQVVSIAGAGAGFGRVDSDNLNGEKGYSMFGAIAKFAGTADSTDVR